LNFSCGGENYAQENFVFWLHHLYIIADTRGRFRCEQRQPGDRDCHNPCNHGGKRGRQSHRDHALPPCDQLPKSKQFDADVGNPCNGMGNGALNDVAQNSLEHKKLQHALVLADQALHAKDLRDSQQYAARVSQALNAVNTGG
jgi:hypothetical protein